ncbi:hypothetical protein GRI58_00165 [Porphyrobacter algicida]|uniref:Uncharacterized protein n=2 Tax=Qipengyuania algicida TaxID=1836209 RepID=A0A845AEK8_9SPHN|nr:hypothetical protein [Qipengyuania algicida]
MRRDRAPARSQADAIDSAQAVVEQLRDQWRKSPQVAQLLAELHDYGRGADLRDCAALAECLTSTTAATRVLAPLFVTMGQALRGHPLAHVPLRHQFAHGVCVLELMRAGQASLSLMD